jgi:prolycopene isomerase
LNDGTTLHADEIVYSGTVWNLYEKLIDASHWTQRELRWERALQPTYPSVMLYAQVDRSIIPADTAPIEMLVGNPDHIDESEVTVYLFSIDDKTLCDADSHVLMAIGPSFEKWNPADPIDYQAKKSKEEHRLMGILEKRFPGIGDHVTYSEVGTPSTIERYAHKNNGAVAGPLQKLGQHMFKRLHIRTKWDSLYCCGESTVLGTGTPAVTVSGLSAANAILKKRKLEQFIYRDGMKDYVRIVPHPFTREQLYSGTPEEIKQIQLKASRCENCEHPACMAKTALDIRGILRRVSVGNFVGAQKLLSALPESKQEQMKILSESQTRCIQNARHQQPVAILEVIDFLQSSRE